MSKQNRYFFENYEVFSELDYARSIHRFTRFEGKGYVKPTCNIFRLLSLTTDDIYYKGIPAILNGDNEQIVLCFFIIIIPYWKTNIKINKNVIFSNTHRAILF